MPIQVQKASDAEVNYEYGCDLRRLYPWDGVADPVFWGSAIASVRPNECTTAHSHDEDESFVVMSGTGTIHVDDESTSVGAGDVIYLPRNSTHRFQNDSGQDPLVFLTIYWGSPEAKAALAQTLRVGEPA